MFRRLVKEIAERTMGSWEPPSDRELPTWNIQTWAVLQTERALCKRIHQQWRRLLSKANPAVLAVHKSVFAATLDCCELLYDPELYRNEYLVHDIANYRAAAIAAANYETMTTQADRLRFLGSRELAATQECAKRLGVSFRYDVWRPEAHSHPPWNECLPNWPAMFSITGEPYRSLNRTLMNLPGGVPHGLVCWLPAVHLIKPITDRLELLVIALFQARAARLPTPDRDQNLRVFLRANRGQIKDAISRVARATRNNLSHRRTRDVRFVVEYLMDFPDPHDGNIVGLARKSIRWHHHQIQDEADSVLKHLGGNVSTVRRPTSLPDSPEIRFLATVEEVCEEGVAMKHCIATRAYDAVRGNAYLFHVEHKGQSASVEVSPYSGNVVQAAGPGNELNQAAKWATRVLNRWGRGLVATRDAGVQVGLVQEHAAAGCIGEAVPF